MRKILEKPKNHSKNSEGSEVGQLRAGGEVRAGLQGGAGQAAGEPGPGGPLGRLGPDQEVSLSPFPELESAWPGRKGRLETARAFLGQGLRPARTRCSWQGLGGVQGTSGGTPVPGSGLDAGAASAEGSTPSPPLDQGWSPGTPGSARGAAVGPLFSPAGRWAV